MQRGRRSIERIEAPSRSLRRRGVGFFARHSILPAGLAWETSISLRRAPMDRPDPKLLEWHGKEIFLG
jgi:hypothetical protein